MISNKIMKIDEHKKSITYKASCDCTSKDCDLILDLEVDENDKMLFLSLYKDLYWASSWTSKDNWFLDKWLRIKAAFRVLFCGYIKVEETFIMRENQIDDFVKALQEGKEKLGDNNGI